MEGHPSLSICVLREEIGHKPGTTDDFLTQGLSTSSMAGRVTSLVREGKRKGNWERGGGKWRGRILGNGAYSAPRCLERCNRRGDRPQSHAGQPAPICIKCLGAFCHPDLYQPGAHTHSSTPQTHAHHRPTHRKGTPALIQETTDPCLFAERKPHGHSREHSDTRTTSPQDTHAHTCYTPAPRHSDPHLTTVHIYPHPIAT